VPYVTAHNSVAINDRDFVRWNLTDNVGRGVNVFDRVAFLVVEHGLFFI